ncbi:MAG TPA: UvrD-helicase domain-containing protein [Burkholderiaceae bacterium]|nr:UvrD-helicase domain-containing protein [Burkholderiaceae bacterium]
MPFDEPEDKEDRIVAVMDLHQEQLARSLGEGHRIIRGVAGSGKTLILAFRAQYLARAAEKPVLLLCYTNGIAGRLEDVMQQRGVEDRVQVSTFHSWCFRILRTYDIAAPSPGEMPDYEERLAASVNSVTKAVEAGQIPGGQYDAVLIDEAHDFEPQWLALAAKMVDPDKRSLMIVYDNAQAIFKGRETPVWKRLGIDAQGRTTVLKVNYRNTMQILSFAKRFAADVIGAPGVQADDESAVLMPEGCGREGPELELRKCVDYDAEGHAIAEWLQARRAAGYDWPQMAVLYPEHRIGERFAEVFVKHAIPVDVARFFARSDRLVFRLELCPFTDYELRCRARNARNAGRLISASKPGLTRASHHSSLAYAGNTITARLRATPRRLVRAAVCASSGENGIRACIAARVVRT